MRIIFVRALVAIPRRTTTTTIKLPSLIQPIQRILTQPYTTTNVKTAHPKHQSKMSGSGFSNADTGNKPADPYKQANLDTEVPLEQKIKDLAGFMTSNKFSMMTTRDSKTGYLLSRCMALAATVCSSDLTSASPIPFTDTNIQQLRNPVASTYSSTPTPSPVRRTTSSRTSTSTSRSSTARRATGPQSAAPPASSRTATWSRSTTAPSSRPGSVIWATASMTAARRTPASVSSASR